MLSKRVFYKPQSALVLTGHALPAQRHDKIKLIKGSSPCLSTHPHPLAALCFFEITTQLGKCLFHKRKSQFRVIFHNDNQKSWRCAIQILNKQIRGNPSPVYMRISPEGRPTSLNFTKIRQRETKEQSMDRIFNDRELVHHQQNSPANS